MDEANCDGDRRWHGGTMFAQKEGRRACAEPRSVFGKAAMKRQLMRRREVKAWMNGTKFQLPARGRETRVSYGGEEEEEGWMDEEDGWIDRQML